MKRVRLGGWLALVLIGAACGGSTDPTTVPADATTVTDLTDGCAHVEAVTVEAAADGTFRFDVTVRSSDTGNEKYADAWEVRTAEGTTIAVRELLHPHVNEQPFTRSLGGVAVAEDIQRVEVFARDSVLGFCGRSMSVEVPGR